MTESLLQNNYRVAVFDVNNDIFSNMMFFFCDVTHENNVLEAVNAVTEKWGQIDVLVNNACICNFIPFEERLIKHIREEFEVNYFGYIHMIKAVLPYMKTQGQGIIHNVSSGVGITGFSGISGYSSTKGAIESLTRTLSFELAPYGISVNLMHPSLTRTNSSVPLGIPTHVMADPAKIGSKFAKKILSKKPIITPNLQTEIYLFLARRYPNMMGRLFSKLTERENQRR